VTLDIGVMTMVFVFLRLKTMMTLMQTEDECQGSGIQGFSIEETQMLDTFECLKPFHHLYLPFQQNAQGW
jgi:hypothetical protein